MLTTIPFVILLASSPVAENDVDLFRSYFPTLSNAEGAAYRELRSRAINLYSKFARESNASIFNENEWKRTVDWKQWIYFDIVKARVEFPDLANSLERIPVFVPSRYLLNRAKRPFATQTTLQLPPSAQALLFELWFKAESVGAISEESAFPSGISKKQIAAYQLQEKQVLQGLILRNLSTSEHPAARFLIEDAAFSSGISVETRTEALMVLGRMGHWESLEPKLQALVQDPHALLDLRLAAVVAMSDASNPRSVDALLQTLSRSEQSNIVRAALKGLTRRISRGVNPTDLEKMRGAMQAFLQKRVSHFHLELVELFTAWSAVDNDALSLLSGDSWKEKILSEVEERRTWAQKRKARVRDQLF